MQVDDDAPQGVPQGEPAPQPADNQALDTGAEPNPSTEGEDVPNPDPSAQEAEKPKHKPWFQSRIDDLTREKWESKRALDAANAELQRLRTPQQPSEDGSNDRPLTNDDVQRLAREEAARITSQRDFDATCNSIHDQGTKTFPDFADALGNFRLLGGLPPSLVEAAAETGEAAKVLYELGKNPDEAARILALSPTRMAVAVAKLAAKPVTPPPVSRAPPPIKPLKGKGSDDADPDPSDVAAWIEKRNRAEIH